MNYFELQCTSFPGKAKKVFTYFSDDLMFQKDFVKKNNQFLPEVLQPDHNPQVRHIPTKGFHNYKELYRSSSIQNQLR